MSSPTTVAPPPTTVTRRRFTVADFHRMAEAGIFTEDDRVELIDGEVLEMTPIGPRHAATVKRLVELLTTSLSGSAIVSVQDPIQLADDTEPQPDLAVLRRRADYYAEAHPTTADVLLVIEVADTSLGYDRSEKLPRYARAGILEVWLVDLSGNRIEQHTNPHGDQYGSKQTFGRGQTVIAQTVSLALPVDDILG